MLLVANAATGELLNVVDREKYVHVRSYFFVVILQPWYMYCVPQMCTVVCGRTVHVH